MQNNVTVQNVTIRQAANDIARNNKKVLILMMLAMAGIGIAANLIISAITGAIGSASVTTDAYGYSSVNSGAAGLAAIISLVGTLAVSLLTSGLNLGYYYNHIILCRGGNPMVSGIFSRLDIFFKAWLQTLWVGLKVIAWALPGYGVMILGALIGGMAQSEALLTLAMFGGMALLFALMIPAALRYSLATWVMADRPEVGVKESVNISKQLMEGRKWQYFKLTIPYILVMYGVLFGGSLAVGLLAGLLGEAGVVVSAVGMIALVIFLVVYALRFPVACTLFYVELTRTEAQDETEPRSEGEISRSFNSEV